MGNAPIAQGATVTTAVLVAMVGLATYSTVRITGANARLRQEVARTEELRDFMGTMLLLLTPEGSAGADPTARLLAKAEEAANRFANAPEIQARLSDRVGGVLLARGQFDVAAPDSNALGGFGSKHRAQRVWPRTQVH